MSEVEKRIILELYESGSYNVLGNTNTKDCCGVTLNEALKSIREQMENPKSNEPTQYKCGHSGKPIILDDNLLSITAWMEWSESVGIFGDKTMCWECWCKD